jgi:hypothetical protein
VNLDAVLLWNSPHKEPRFQAIERTLTFPDLMPPGNRRPADSVPVRTVLPSDASQRVSVRQSESPVCRNVGGTREWPAERNPEYISALPEGLDHNHVRIFVLPIEAKLRIAAWTGILADRQDTENMWAPASERRGRSLGSISARAGGGAGSRAYRDVLAVGGTCAFVDPGFSHTHHPQPPADKKGIVGQSLSESRDRQPWIVTTTNSP